MKSRRWCEQDVVLLAYCGSTLHIDEKILFHKISFSEHDQNLGMWGIYMGMVVLKSY